ncbi:NAD-dependent epimerase/dehydratase FUM13 [Colletotrichum trifolii]|uniref:NAD-dependent epimerase/dehydratase FUM13 n=1 Tax=Colletotrichum trifolii TaxID=5466 RepID=A0A4R8QQZ3_COLTR|nr:NAD-dependent epimerase/dehydratase FUM13 [Colletotrichum trifolii]
MLRNISGDVLLITGATGHVGFAVLVHALSAGYAVRCAVRSEAKAEMIRSRPRICSLNLPDTRLTFTIIPDITVDGAYDDSMHGVSAVIHIASPFPSSDPIPPELHHKHFIQPAVHGTLNILRAAKCAPTVRRVVFTSSVVALASLDQLEGRERRLSPVHPDERTNHIADPYESMFAAYAASKVTALRHAEAWMAAERPPFDAVHLHPSFVIGRNDMSTTAAEAMRGSNAIVLATVRGKKFGCGYIGAAVHIDDVARAHVQAVLPSVPGDRSYILSTRVRWNDAKLVAKRRFPEAVERGVIARSGSVGTIHIDFDASVTETVFGIEFQGFEKQVASAVGHYIELRMKRPAFALQRAASATGPPLGMMSQHYRADMKAS